MRNILKKYAVKFNIVKILSIPLFLFRIFPIKNNRILFQNFTGKGYGDSPKYIAEELKDTQYDLFWVIRKNVKNDLPKYIKTIRLYSIKYFYILATSKYWISNSRFDQYVIKRKKQIYIQTWHSPLRLKKIEMDAYDSLNPYYRKVMRNDSKMINYMISGCDFSYNIYKNSFLYTGEILKIGTPRCDLFFNDKTISYNKCKVFEHFNITNEKKIILYAPTFRTKRDINEYLMNYEKVVNNLKNDYIILVRLHPRVNFTINESKNIVDASKYPDMQELLCASDILITDYSSCCFDMMIANKPCLLFTKDLNQYIDEERDLYFDIQQLPFFKAQNEEDIIKFINNNNYIEYDEKIEKFKKNINLYENGCSTKEIIKLIKKGELK